MAAISQSIKFIGMGDVIEIWNNEEPEKAFMNAENFCKAIEAVMGKTEGGEKDIE
jgi:MraZ protein